MMKRSQIYTVILLVCMVFVLEGCRVKKALDDFSDCLTLSTDYLEKYNAFMEDQTKANCEAYKASLQKYVDDCDEATAESREDLEQEIAEMDCSQY